MGRTSRPTATTPSARAASQLGARIRKARHDSGLSLAQVAGKDLSRPFLNQIELGQARPSTKTLQAIARRLQRPIEYFLEDPDLSRTALELALAEGETALRQGDAGRTKALMAGLLERPHLPIEPLVPCSSRNSRWNFTPSAPDFFRCPAAGFDTPFLRAYSISPSCTAS